MRFQPGLHADAPKPRLARLGEPPLPSFLLQQLLLLLQPGVWICVERVIVFTTAGTSLWPSASLHSCHVRRLAFNFCCRKLIHHRFLHL
ncbi:Hypothetical predicted protein [Podarcis lilfordi]|uniref:Uncharacterized protein n=1 Tax=Podarcis lilfordi TaxID=74358 RepID=A0AA35L9H3_9SAUR|nr:Hypothetical predicted protein [Podarcis lilfordi]